MKKQLALVLAVLLVGASFAYPTKAESKLKLSESDIEFYPSERLVVVISSNDNIDVNKLQIKSKDIDVKKEGCMKTDIDYSCLLTFSSFKSTSEKVEIKYGNQVFYVNTRVKSLENLNQNMSLDEQYEIALAKLLTKYNVIVPDDIKDEKIRSDVEIQIEKLKDKYTDTEDKKDLDDKNFAVSTAVGDVLLTAEGNTVGVLHGHAGIHSTIGHTSIETRGPLTGGVKIYKDSIKKDWLKKKKKTGLWTVYGSPLAKKTGAVKWAEKQQGKPYGLIEGGTGSFFCTKLVWMSWESQGKKIGHYWFATDMMTKSKPLKLRNLYHK